ncbi:hypothetical protein [Natrinema thermotolerans]
MTVSREAVDSYLEELNDLAEEILIETEWFFNSAEVERKVDRAVGEVTYVWKTPNSNQKKQQQKIIEKYLEWYAGGRSLVSEYIPEELDEFENLKGDFYQRITLNTPARSSPKKTYSPAHDAFVTQRGIVNSVSQIIAVEQLKVKKQISKSLSKDEVGKSRHLLDQGFPRASGVLAGIALERHLLTLCEESNEELDFHHDDGIASLSQTLYEGDEIDKTTLSALETLSSLRADCAHANEKEPSEHKVRRLIEDTEDYIRGRGL